ncbi:alpha-1-antiproteinase F-like [Paramacrobiotus metropolitanus]|uniref:alpha-1-antiproteinase F-like n=1 Tax=Paramacrobiotus metropolitanus TaxID=2943436 RepID=UPI0024464AA3|nr:alpha-1-antiproteinase F-like [Paramacrobiotus metropolitanus]
MVLLLPPPDGDGTTRQLEATLTVERLLRWREKSSQIVLHILVSKFRITYTTDLQPLVASRGLTPFCLRHLIPETVDHVLHVPATDPLSVGEFGQQIILDLWEYGLTTSPFESFNMTPLIVKCVPDFVVNRPFLVVIWNEMVNVPLIIARVTDPTIS